MQKNLFSKKCIDELKNRLEALDNDSIPNWGQMNVSQMFAHCCEVLKNALGETQQKRKFIGYLVAPFFRHRFYDAEPYKKKGGPSTFIIGDEKEFGFFDNFCKRHFYLLVGWLPPSDEQYIPIRRR